MYIITLFDESVIYQKCKSFSEADNSIYINDLIVEYCSSNVPLYFEFINSGSSISNCGLHELSKVLIVKINEEKEREKEKKIDIFFKYNNIWHVI